MPRSNSQDWSVNDTITANRLQDINEDIDDLYSGGSDRGLARLALSTLPLAIDVFPFTYLIGVAQGNSTGILDFVLADNATNYVEVNTAGVIISNIVGFNPSNAKLAIVTTLGGAITNIENLRPDLVGDVGGAGGGFENITSAVCQTGLLKSIVADTIGYDLEYYNDGTLKEIKTGVLTTTITYGPNGCLETVITI